MGVGPDSEPRPPYDEKVPWNVAGKGSVPPVLGSPRTLKLDMKGEDVKGLQKILIGAGHLPPPPDGVFGKRTLEAVKRFQAQLGVKADGVVGAKTHAAIARLLAFLAATQH